MSELHLDGQVQAFFDTFAAASDPVDTDRLAELFAETFLAADPAGVQAVPRQAFLHALPRRAELFAAAGIARVVLADLQHHALDDTYVLARTDWLGERTAASTPIRLSSTFILRRDADRLRVVFYLTTKTSRGPSAWPEVSLPPAERGSARLPGPSPRPNRLLAQLPS